MSSPFDETDFIDRDLQSNPTTRGTAATPGAAAAIAPRPPTREELESKVNEAQNRIAELKRAQEELERERAKLDEARRRRTEFETGRAEMLQHLTRGIGILEQAEFKARRDAEQMTKTLAGFREALGNVQAIQEQTWTQENWNSELTRALTAIENARMEWNAARLKWTVLDGAATGPENPPVGQPAQPDWLTAGKAGALWKTGLALTWPLALAVVAGVIVLAALLWRR
jgi:exonuclease VII large subunit